MEGPTAINVSLTPELERVVNEKLESGMYQTASEVVRDALRLLKERDEARARLRADVQAEFEQLARGEARSYDKASGRQLAERIKSKGRAARARKPLMSYRLSFLAEQDLEEIWTHVAEDASPATADRLIDAIVGPIRPPRQTACSRTPAT